MLREPTPIAITLCILLDMFLSYYSFLVILAPMRKWTLWEWKNVRIMKKFTHMCARTTTHTHIYIYIYIDRERERERERKREREREREKVKESEKKRK